MERMVGRETNTKNKRILFSSLLGPNTFFFLSVFEGAKKINLAPGISLFPIVNFQFHPFHPVPVGSVESDFVKSYFVESDFV